MLEKEHELQDHRGRYGDVAACSICGCHFLVDELKVDTLPNPTVRKRLGRLGVTTLFVEPGSPWENGYIESFNGRLRDDEVLNGEIFSTPLEARVLTESWRRNYNTIRPHSALGYKPPAPEAVMPNNGYLVEGLTLKVV